MNTQYTADKAATEVAQAGYNIAQAAREAHGFSDLPDWGLLDPPKRGLFVAAARAALDGRPRCDVWSVSIGVEPDVGTPVHYDKKAPVFKLLPEAISSCASLAVNLGLVMDEPEGPASDMLDDPDAAPTVEEAIEDYGLGAEEVSEAITAENEKPAPVKKAAKKAAKKTTKTR